MRLLAKDPQFAFSDLSNEGHPLVVALCFSSCEYDGRFASERAALDIRFPSSMQAFVFFFVWLLWRVLSWLIQVMRFFVLSFPGSFSTLKTLPILHSFRAGGSTTLQGPVLAQGTVRRDRETEGDLRRARHRSRVGLLPVDASPLEPHR